MSFPRPEKMLFLPLILSAFASLLLSGCAFLLRVPPAEGAVTSFTLASAYGTDYAISVWVPPGLAAGEKVPALYVLDGDEALASTAQIADDDLKASGLRVMVVGIGYGSAENMRTRDYTPTVADGEGGGGAAFLDFIAGRLIPRIESDYPAIRDRSGRAIAGHSFGGLAVLQALFAKSDVFSGFIAMSPSLWWGGSVMFDRLPDFLAAAGLLPATRFYLSVGSHEGEGMEILLQEFSSRIEGASIPALSTKTEVIPNRRHWDVRLTALPAGFAFVIGGT